MGFHKDEQEVKQKSQFLEYESGDMGNNLILLSHLYKTDTHFLRDKSKYVLCHEDDCMYCAAGYQVLTEYNYYVDLNGQRGFLNIKSTPFFDIKKISKSQGKDARQISWTVIKTGSGLDTKYVTSKDDNLAPEDFERVTAELDATDEKLGELMKKQEERLDENYRTYLRDIKGQTKMSSRKAKDEDEETVDPNDVPDFD